MHLVIVAAERPGNIAGRADARTLRLAGIPQPGETPPPNLLTHADDAAAEIRRTFPEWLWRWAVENEALDLAIWPGPVSWWWLTEISEMSPLRSRVLRELYWL